MPVGRLDLLVSDTPCAARPGMFSLVAERASDGGVELVLIDPQGVRHQLTTHGVVRLTDYTPAAAYRWVRVPMWVFDVDGVGVSALTKTDFTASLNYGTGGSFGESSTEMSLAIEEIDATNMPGLYVWKYLPTKFGPYALHVETGQKIGGREVASAVVNDYREISDEVDSQPACYIKTQIGDATVYIPAAGTAP